MYLAAIDKSYENKNGWLEYTDKEWMYVQFLFVFGTQDSKDEKKSRAEETVRTEVVNFIHFIKTHDHLFLSVWH